MDAVIPRAQNLERIISDPQAIRTQATPTTKVTNKPHHQRRIKACMKKEEDGGDELHWESPICNMVEEAVGTRVYCEGKLIWLCIESQEVANL